MWDYNLDRMNENKKGKPYSFPDSFILLIGHIRVYFHLPYRQTEGIIKATGKNLPSHPSYSQICRRVNKLDIISNRLDDDDDDDDDDDNGIIIAIDIQHKDNKQRSMDAREMAGQKEERLSKDPHCCKYQDQRNTRFRSYR